MVKLANVLHCRHFHVTFVNTEYNHRRRLVRSRGPAAGAGLPGFRFATIPDGLPESDADATQDPASLCDSTMTTCTPHLKKLAARPAQRRRQRGAARDVRRGGQRHELQLGRRQGGRRAVRALLDRQRMRLHGLPPLPVPHRRRPCTSQRFVCTNLYEEQLRNGCLDTPVGWARGVSKHMRLRDFPTFIYTMRRGDVLLDFMMREVARTDAVILNTFDEL
ncbi:hypothetical protein SETIT_1G208300v2 [Setaria italica]|uniref:Uncharacterized protein n=1 Tax=Setaria italica TaxID=4555 RepID=A0A368PPR0_SETIT|nr:hypothetical protein SETIT_1G208300v2 [Setaria italica]